MVSTLHQIHPHFVSVFFILTGSPLLILEVLQGIPLEIFLAWVAQLELHVI